MLKDLFFCIKYFLFWLVLFFINRLFFEIWNHAQIFNNSLTEIFKTFLYGIHMDASMAGYICVIPFLLFVISWNIPSVGFRKTFIDVYTYVLIFLTSLFTLIDINIVREWGTKFNYRAIVYFLDSTGDAIASSSSSPVIASFSSIAVLTLIGILLYKVLLKRFHIDHSNRSLIYKIPMSLLVLGLTFLAVRGGWSIAPMNTSKAYFSEKQILNYAAINTDWFLLANVLANQKTKGNPYHYFSEQEMKNMKDSLLVSSTENQINILKNPRPNVILIIMESFTADLVKELGGETGVTPKFSELIQQGLLFNHVYSASDRTDKGIVAAISGFPSQAIRSIIKENDKQGNLPSISQALVQQKYHTSFFYGGDTDFSNFKSYLLSHAYHQIIDVKYFKPAEVTSKWGAYDEVTFQKQINYLNSAKQPFFSTLLTLSNHEPFELPTKGKYGDASVENKFRSTSFYTDGALYHYVEEAKKQSWYANTLFIIVADHGHRLPKSVNEIYNPARYHIPLLFFGGALKEEYKGQRIDKYGSQVDIASTLLNQMDVSDTAFHYSKNLLNPHTKGFAFYSWDNGFGYIDQDKSVSYDPTSKKILFTVPEKLEEAKKKKALADAKALMQSVYTDFLNY